MWTLQRSLLGCRIWIPPHPSTAASPHLLRFEAPLQRTLYQKGDALFYPSFSSPSPSCFSSFCGPFFTFYLSCRISCSLYSGGLFSSHLDPDFNYKVWLPDTLPSHYVCHLSLCALPSEETTSKVNLPLNCACLRSLIAADETGFFNIQEALQVNRQGEWKVLEAEGGGRKDAGKVLHLDS